MKKNVLSLFGLRRGWQWMMMVVAMTSTAFGALEWVMPWTVSEPVITVESRAWAEPLLTAVQGKETIVLARGRLAESVVWDASKTYLVMNTIYVPNGVTLTIGAGTVVKFCPGTFIKVEDGGKLKLTGESGKDVILTAVNDGTVGESVPGFEGETVVFPGIVLQSGSAMFEENGYLQTRGFKFGSFPTLTLHPTTAFASGGVARIPVTLNNVTRVDLFSIDWVAEADGKIFQSGSLTWSKTGEGTKTIEIPFDDAFAAAHDGFTIRVVAHRGCNVASDTCAVTLSQWMTLPIVAGEAVSAAVSYDARKTEMGKVARGEVTLGEPEGGTPTQWDTTALKDGWQKATVGENEAELLVLNDATLAIEGGRLAASTTWDNTVTHLLRHAVYVPSGVTLTITEGTVVKFGEGTYIKVEDGGKLEIKGAAGQDVILTAANDTTVGATVPGLGDETITYGGVWLQSGSATFTDNSYVQMRGVNYGNYPAVTVHDVTRFTTDGIAYLPVTLNSVTRNAAFSIDWVAEADGKVFQSGMLTWSKTGEGTKTIEIPFDQTFGEAHSAFTVKVVTHRACNVACGSATVTLLTPETVAITTGVADSAAVRYEGRESETAAIVRGEVTFGEPEGGAPTQWDTTALMDGWQKATVGENEAELLVLNDATIALEGGRLAANTTWDNTVTHLLRNAVYVPSGVTLTITEGTVVKFGEGTYIKVEDGGKLNVVGAAGQDVILTAANDTTVGTTVPGLGDETIAYGGVWLQSGSATFTDNSYVQMRGVNYGNYPAVTIHDAVAERMNGGVYVPVTLSGATRNQAFSFDWKAVDDTAKVEQDYTLASGSMTWSKSGEGTKWIYIPFNTDTIAGASRTFTIEIETARAVNISRGVATVQIDEYSNCGLNGDEVTVTIGTESAAAPIQENIAEQVLFLNEVEKIQYSGRWQKYDAAEAKKVRVTLATDNGVTILKETTPEDTGAFDLTLADWPVGYYTLSHEVENDYGEVLAKMSKSFSILDHEDYEWHAGTLTQNERWTADKVHVVYFTVYVPALYTLFVEPGAVVKFMTGAGIDISQGGAFFGDSIIFTHLNDDTVGGDVLSDGYTVAPPMDAYFLKGDFTFGDDTELRNITQKTALSGTISSNKKLSKGSVYRVSGTLTIASGASLTIPAGTVLKMESGASINVKNGATLTAEGTRAQPIIITSIKDDSIGGDTNGDGNKTLPQPGDWCQISVAGKASFNYTSVHYNSSLENHGGVEANGGEITFENSEIAHTKYECVNVRGGRFIARNSVFRDASLGFGYFGGSNVEAYNCIFADLTVAVRQSNKVLVNCIFYNCFTAFTDQGGDGSTFKNCLFYNPPAYGPQAYNKVGQDGNIWGDPLFVDPMNGDFRIVEGSPCVDAADSSVAPIEDYYGQPRITITEQPEGEEPAGQLADIGICEVMPRDITSDIDLVPLSVRTASEAKPGELLFVKWEVQNVGGAAVEHPWRDTILLVSENDYMVTLGDKVAGNQIVAGGTVFCSGYFTVPAIAEGTWYVKVNVNSYRDIFEGSLIQNNALTGDRPVTISLEAFDADTTTEGWVAANTAKVLKFTYGEEDANRMMTVKVPAGVKVTWGFGFVPQGVANSGSVIADANGATFRVPEDAIDVYVVIESDTNVEYEVSTESTKIVVTSVYPTTLPSSGTTSLTITGAGFDNVKSIVLATAGGMNNTLETFVQNEEGNLITTVDCSTLQAGAVYTLTVSNENDAASLNNAITVTKAEGKGQLVLEYEVPESARVGRVFTFKVVYRNVGNKDMSCPMITVKDTGTDLEHPTQFSLTGTTFTPYELQFVGKDTLGGFDALRPGDEVVLYLYAKIPAAQTGASSILVRANTENDLMAKYTTEIDRYLTPSRKKAFANTTNDEVKAYGEALAKLLGKTNGEMVQNLAAHAKLFYTCNGFALQEVSGLLNYISLKPQENDMGVTLCATPKNDVTLFGSELYVDSGVYFYGGNGWQSIGTLDLGDGDVVLIAHGLGNSIEESAWMTDLADALSKCGRYKYVLGVNWGKEVAWSNGGPVSANNNFTSMSKKVHKKMIEWKVCPSRLTLIGHSYGSHLLGQVGKRFKGAVYRHIGLDTAETWFTYDFAEVNSKHAKRTEYYRSSIFLGRDDPYADYNFLVVKPKGFSSWEVVDAIGNHSYAWEWFIDNVKAGKGSGIGLWSDDSTTLEKSQGRYFGVINGEENKLECMYKYGKAGFKYPGKLPTWHEMYDKWNKSADLDIVENGRVSLQENAELIAGETYPITVTIANNCDIRTTDSLFEYKVQIYYIVENKRNFLCEEIAIVQRKESVDLHFDDIELPRGVNVTALEFVVSPIRIEYHNYMDHDGKSITEKLVLDANELFEKDNCKTIPISVIDKGKCQAWINNQFQDGFVIEHKVPYDSWEEYVEAAEKGETCIVKLDGTRSMPSEGESIEHYIWRDETDSVLGTEKKLECVCSATDDACYDIALTVATDRVNDNDTVKGKIHVIPVFSETGKPITKPQSCDPNEMAGPLGFGDSETERFVKPGEWLTYTVYFENKREATAAAQEVRVTNPLSEYLDWSTFTMGEVAFNNQIDLGLDGKQLGASEVALNNTAYKVKTTLDFDQTKGEVNWYLRILDPSTETTWPEDIYAGILPPNDDTHCGEGHLTYRVKVRDDASAGMKITNSASIIFDYNDPIETDPAWWNTVAPPHFTQTFNANGGEGSTSVTLEYGADLTAAQVTREGYTLTGWLPEVPTTVPAQNVTYVAQWQINQYTATFKPNNGAADIVLTQDYNTPLVVAAPTRVGYTFAGWFTDKDTKAPAKMPAENATYTAKWTINQYTVTFRPDNGAENIVRKQDYDSPFIVDAPTREGYTFIGWYTDKDNKAPGKMPAANMTYTAKWTINQYTATFKLYEGEKDVVLTQDYNTPLAISDPTHEGYTFKGWDKEVPVTMPAVDTTYTAQWQINQYTATFKLENGAEDIVKTQDYASALSVEDPTREGYTFVAWDKEVPATVPAENTTYTAQWQINQYTATFKSENGMADIVLTQDYGTVITVSNPTREGYTFAGWSPSVPASMPASDVTYVAQWTVNQYTATFKLYEGAEDIVLTQDYASALSIEDPTREGYTFKGWDKEVPATVPAENTTYTAQWQINQYTATFKSENGMADIVLTQDYGSVIAVSNPTREGYTFAGWSPSVPASMPASDVTYVAQWTVNQYTATFKLYDGAEDIVLTQDYASALSVEDPTREGYTFVAWDKEVPATMPAVDTTYTAQWTVSQYTATFKLNNGEKDIVRKQNYDTDLTAPTVTRTGYTFAGWDKPVPEKMPAENTTYTAKWTVNQYTATFKLNNGEKDIVRKQNYDTDLTAPTVKRTGYQLIGWLPAVPKKMPATNETYVAQWALAKLDAEKCLKYTTNKKGEATITDCEGKLAGWLEIPDKLGDATVTAIANGAFKGQTLLEKVTLPNTITSIGKDAFKDCINLDVNAIVLPNQPKLKVGKGAFTGCKVAEITAVPGESKTGTGVAGYKVATSVSGFKLNAKKGTWTATFKKPGTYEAVLFKLGANLKVVRIKVGAVPTVSVTMEGANKGCSVKGAGAYLMGKKVTLTAKTSKEKIFVGFFDAQNNLVSSAMKYTFVMGRENVTLTAKFKEEVIDTSISTLTATQWQVGQSYTITLPVTAESGVKSVKAKLPSGLKLSKTKAGVWQVTGSPKKAGTYTVTITVGTMQKKQKVDSATITVKTETTRLDLTAVKNATLNVSQGVSNLVIGASATSQIKSVKASKLPSGMKVQCINGVWQLTGTPKKAGTYKVTVTMTTKAGTKVVETLTLTVNLVPEWAAKTFSGTVINAWEGDDGDWEEVSGLANVTITTTGAVTGSIYCEDGAKALLSGTAKLLESSTAQVRLQVTVPWFDPNGKADGKVKTELIIENNKGTVTLKYQDATKDSYVTGLLK